MRPFGELAIKFIQWLSSFVLRYPSLSHAQLTGELAAKCPAQEELDSLMSISDRRGGHLKFIAAFYIIYGAKNLFLQPYLLFSLVNYRNTSSNLRRGQRISLIVEAGREPKEVTLDRFACFATNCSSLLDLSTLEQDVLSLPIVSGCWPRASRLFSKLVLNEPYAALPFMTTGLLCILLGGLLPLLMLRMGPLQNDTLIFLLAPRTTINMWRQRVSEMLTEFRNSFENFQLIVWSCPLGKRVSKGRRHYANNKFKTNHRLNRQSRPSKVDEFEVRANMPSIRQLSWHEQISQVHLNRALIIHLLQLIFALIAVCDIVRVHLRECEINERIASHIERVNCNVWIVDEHSKSIGMSQLLNLRTFKRIGPELITYIDLLAQAIPNLIIPLVLFQYATNIFELNHWLDELKEELKLARDRSELAHLRSRFSLSSSSSPSWDEIYGGPRRVLLKVDIKTWARQGAHNEAQWEHLERIYISFRLLVGFVKSCSKAALPLIFVSATVYLSHIVTAVFNCRLVGHISRSHASLIAFAAAYPLSVIFILSSFHVKVSFSPTR